MATLQETYYTGGSSVYNTQSPYWCTQIFQAGSNYELSSVKLQLKRAASAPGTITISIRAVTGTPQTALPTGSDLASGTTNGDTLTQDIAGEKREITLSSPLSLTSGTYYAIVLKGPTAPAIVSWIFNTNGTYADGNYATSSNSGGAWAADATNDFMFETWGSSTTYSELAGNCAGVGGGSADLAVSIYSALAGTCAAVGGGSAELGSTLVYTSGYKTYKRLIVAGNNQIWFEDI